MCNDKEKWWRKHTSYAESENSPYDDKIVLVHDKIKDHNRINKKVWYHAFTLIIIGYSFYHPIDPQPGIW